MTELTSSNSMMFDDFTPPKQLVEQWYRMARPFWLLNDIATRAAFWGYSKCQAEYERAAMKLVEPTWLETEEESPMDKIDHYVAAKAIGAAYEEVLEHECVVTENDFKALQKALLMAIEQVAPENSIADIDYVHQAYVDGYRDALAALGKIAQYLDKLEASLS